MGNDLTEASLEAMLKKIPPGVKLTLRPTYWRWEAAREWFARQPDYGIEDLIPPKSGDLNAKLVIDPPAPTDG